MISTVFTFIFGPGGSPAWRRARMRWCMASSRDAHHDLFRNNW